MTDHTLVIPDVFLKFDLELDRHSKVWFTWGLTTTHWFRGKGMTPEIATADLIENYNANVHVGIKQKATITNFRADGEPDMRKKENKEAYHGPLADLF